LPVFVIIIEIISETMLLHQKHCTEICHIIHAVRISYNLHARL